MYKYFDLIHIKKKYGENMSKLCIKLFSTILENEGQLYKIMISNFPPNRFLYHDIINNNLIKQFKNYIFSFVNSSQELLNIDKTPQQLFEEKGYNLYECNNEKDLNKYIKYYQPHEILCTFKGNRLEEKYIFFAIKKNIDSIKRNNEDPNREDDYSTSILCIQFDKGEYNYVNIISRYNHTIKNPNATYENNLENINNGLTKSFEQEYNLNIPNSGIKKITIPGYIKAKDGKYYKYNYCINNIYYCINNIIIDNGVVKKMYADKSRFLLIDYFILDLQNKKIITYPNNNLINKDGFIKCIKIINKIEIANKNDNKMIKIEMKDRVVIIKVNEKNQIIEYYDNKIEFIPKNFLFYNTTLKKIELLNAKIIGDMFLFCNNKLSYINIPNVQELGEYFLYDNNTLEKLNVPQLYLIKNAVLKNNYTINQVHAPNLIFIGDNTFIDNYNKSYRNNRLMFKLKLISIKNLLISKKNIKLKKLI